jgi:DNA invertase Pin-like site-specific DNA recombinase
MLNELRQAARAHQFDVLVIWDFYRLARRMTLQAVIMRELCEAGITIQSVSDGTYEGEEIARFVTMAREYAAQVERERIQARTRRGKATARQQKDQQH